MFSCILLTCRRGDLDLVDPLVDMARNCNRLVSRRPRARRLLRRLLDRRLQGQRTPPSEKRDLAATALAAHFLSGDAAVHRRGPRAGAHAPASVSAALCGRDSAADPQHSHCCIRLIAFSLRFTCFTELYTSRFKFVKRSSQKLLLRILQYYEFFVYHIMNFI